jgi:hypothetical protein
MGRFFPYLGGKTALVPRLLEKMRGKWLLTVGDHPLMRGLYVDHLLEEAEQRLNSQKDAPGATNRTLRTLTAANYAPHKSCHRSAG